jgi:hypothetical protein
MDLIFYFIYIMGELRQKFDKKAATPCLGGGIDLAKLADDWLD